MWAILLGIPSVFEAKVKKDVRRIAQDAKSVVTVRRFAAMYVRMSTEHQQYSIENQTAAIEAYAKKAGMKIVKTYSDGARSGLDLRGRPGLQRLLADTQLGIPDFTEILVLDVSRWGRFQDPDESGHYEFMCRKAGYNLHYVNESFSNDGSMASSLLKNVKRTLAGSYSSELSGKVYAGQARLAMKGFKQGGAPGYGLRRLLISEDGKRRFILRRVVNPHFGVRPQSVQHLTA